MFANTDDAISFLQENMNLSAAPADFPDIAGYLGQSRDRQVFDTLIEALSNGGDYIRAVAAQALGYFGAKEAIPFLITCLVQDPGIYVRCDCASALGMLGAEEALPVFLKVFSEEHFEVQKRIIRSTINIGTKRSLEALRTIEGQLNCANLIPEQKHFLAALVREGRQQLQE